MQGASALEQVLETRAGKDYVVFVVWMHVLSADIAPPIAATRARINDPRARIYWDPDQRISAAALGALQPGRNGVVWDCAGVWKPGRQWNDRLPPPDWQGRPVVQAAPDLARLLSGL